MNNATKQRFSPHTFATYRYVWSLNEQERQQLDRNFMLKTTGKFLDSVVNTQHEFKDTVINNDVEYEIIFMDCGIDSLAARLAAKTLLLSFRHNVYNRLSVCLVREPFSGADLQHIKEL